MTWTLYTRRTRDTHQAVQGCHSTSELTPYLSCVPSRISCCPNPSFYHPPFSFCVFSPLFFPFSLCLCSLSFSSPFSFCVFSPLFLSSLVLCLLSSLSLVFRSMSFLSSFSLLFFSPLFLSSFSLLFFSPSSFCIFTPLFCLSRSASLLLSFLSAFFRSPSFLCTTASSTFPPADAFLTSSWSSLLVSFSAGGTFAGMCSVATLAIPVFANRVSCVARQ
ncbi:hypothetical protein FFLO_02419 [Filobasidium floriforme]|uniref:Transmembrane protein n=1 Tax=Filobasidium floriforme TaxID=5210 RepID=A0A8K0JNY0_9TREE|nr:uncharacterized protein HD553DRAFT_64310 [Filobasidium floriforme]KAG7562137.1 hypothetical protein FFLO_02419 [Filobasidium floriforme]KAH8082702.1 hypothetical protein HD553DRAFT_64310 [Filobasidium floriforme]